MRTAVIALGLTKAGKRAGVQESVSVGHDTAFRYVQQWVALASPQQRLCPSPGRWRKLFKACIESLKLEPLELRPYSLRRGGATWWFCQHGSLDRVMTLGRWQAQNIPQRVPRHFGGNEARTNGASFDTLSSLFSEFRPQTV